MRCVERVLAAKIEDLTAKFPLLFLTGPRQSGKTTLLKNISYKNFDYISLEEMHAYNFAVNDPKGFLNTLQGRVIIDDAHKAPALIQHIKSKIDEIELPCKYILSGHLDSKMIGSISQILSGRAVRLTLLPFSLSELSKTGRLTKTVNEWMFTGSYPELLSSTIDSLGFFRSYTASLVAHDIKSELNKVHGLGKFRRFLAIVAANSCSPVNLSKLAEEVSIDARTANSWISILEEAYILFRLAPYRNYTGKRYVKTPKLYFYDSGFLCFLLGINKPEELNFHQMRNQIFETAIISEAAKKYFNAGFRTKMYYWRDLDNKEKEVDLVEENSKELKLTEIKLSQTANEEYVKNLVDFSSQSDILSLEKTILRQVIYDGNENSIFENVPYINWKHLGE